MDIRFQARIKSRGGNERSDWKADAVIALAFKGKTPLNFIKELAEISPWLEISPALRDFKGGKGETALLYGHPELPISRALFVGLGDKKDFTPERLQDAIALAVKQLSGLKLEQIAISVDNLKALAGVKELPLSLIEETVLAAKLATYDYREYKSAPAKGDDEQGAFSPKGFSLLFSEEFTPDEGQAAARRAEGIAEGIFYARDIINGPGNVVTPVYMEESAQKLAKLHGFKLSSYGPEYLEKEGFGAHMAVAIGSAVEPRLLILEHAPKGTEKDKPIIVVGKGVTFDSGGISLKPSAGMEKMTRDMAGAGTVLGLFAAIGAQPGEIKRRVIGIMPCAENMPDGKATRPGDVVKTLSGKTVEITNTDAEGRLLLCDSLTMAQKMAEPEALIDIATLTGACVVALGDKTAGVFGNNKKLSDKILSISEKAGERMWPLPIFDQDLEGLKSLSADLNNTGPREGGASFAALFLKQFVNDKTPWAHLDIAGPAYQSKGGNSAGGATAFGLRTLFEFVDGK